jgi:hypothetical protein
MIFRRKIEDCQVDPRGAGNWDGRGRCKGPIPAAR